MIESLSAESESCYTEFEPGRPMSGQASPVQCETMLLASGCVSSSMLGIAGKQYHDEAVRILCNSATKERGNPAAGVAGHSSASMDSDGTGI